MSNKPIELSAYVMGQIAPLFVCYVEEDTWIRIKAGEVSRHIPVNNLGDELDLPALDFQELAKGYWKELEYCQKGDGILVIPPVQYLEKALKMVHSLGQLSMKPAFSNGFEKGREKGLSEALEIANSADDFSPSVADGVERRMKEFT